MSRHSAVKSDGTQVVYGFDHALGYFYEEWPEGAEMPSVDLSSGFDGLSRGTFLELLEKTDASEEHKGQVALDLPF